MLCNICDVECLQPKLVDKRYRVRHSFISLQKDSNLCFEIISPHTLSLLLPRDQNTFDIMSMRQNLAKSGHTGGYLTDIEISTNVLRSIS